MEEITLNLIPTGVRPTCHVSQNDNERDIKINLVEGSLAYAIKSGDIVKLNIRKPNDVVISSRITATVGNTYVIANIKDEMCNVDGTNLCEIRITNGDTRISTSNFLMEVEVDPSANGGGGGGASNLADLDDVNISEPSNGQVLKYNGTSEMWENGTGGGGGASAMSDLTDVDLTGLEDGNSLVYDDDDDEWKVQTITKEVTQAEYDALVRAGTVDPKTAYFIKDTNGDGQDFQPIIRSLEEREIGVWTDGKPLYEKTVYHAGGIYGTISIAHNITNLGHCVNAFGTSYDLGYQEGSQRIGAGDLPLPRVASDNNNVGIVGVNSTEVNLMVPSAFRDRVTDIYITLQYTKSTDQAGSGTWTPQGVPAVHYSTDEKVVGTWIDGSTIYEKTFYVSQLPNSGSLNIDTPSNANRLIDAFGFAYSTASTGYYRPMPLAGGGSSDIRIDMQEGVFRVVTYASWANYGAYITFRYTKSSS